MVRVRTMNTMVNTTASTETQSASPKNRNARIPINAPPKCPPNNALG